MKWMVFSKDRPYQLDAFLRTAEKNGKIDPADISVLYRYTDGFEKSIDILKKEHPEVNFIAQGDFKKDVMQWLTSQNCVTVSFATDDALFTRDVRSNFVEFILANNPHIKTFSLRLGLHLDHCYPTNSAQSLPNGTLQEGILFWLAESAEGDWNYPLSVDGHVFRREEIVSMFSKFGFSNPNNLESNWQWLKSDQFESTSMLTVCACFAKSCYFNVPINRVQDEYKNRSGNVSHIELAEKYMADESFRFDPKRCLNFFNKSAHEEISIK
jgi:hypothetical protein